MPQWTDESAIRERLAAMSNPDRRAWKDHGDAIIDAAEFQADRERDAGIVFADPSPMERVDAAAEVAEAGDDGIPY